MLDRARESRENDTRDVTMIQNGGKFENFSKILFIDVFVVLKCGFSACGAIADRSYDLNWVSDFLLLHYYQQ